MDNTTLATATSNGQGGEGITEDPRAPNVGTLLDSELALERLFGRLGVELDEDGKPKGLDETENDEDVLKKFSTAELAGAVWRCIKASGHEFRIVEDTGEFWFYDQNSGIWRPDGENRLAQLANHMLTDATYTRTLRRELKNKVESEPAEDGLRIDRKTLGAEPGLLLVDGGVLDLETRERRRPQPEDHFLRRIPTVYEPDVTLEGTRFKQYLEESVATEDRAKLQEYAGYTLWANAQPFKKACFLIGPTDSGKSTFLDAVELVLGSENVAWQSLYNLIQSRWGTSKIYDKIVNMNDEVTGGPLRNAERFKTLTGGENTVTAEFKGQPTFEFVVTQKLLFATNRFPRMKDAGEAFWNRCLFVEFPETIEKIDRDLLDKFEEERSAILNWMLEGLDRLLEQNGFTAERTLDEKRGLTRSFGSPVDQFVFDAIGVTGHPDDVVHKDGLYNAFTRFCDYIEADDTPAKRTLTTELKQVSGITDGKSRRLGDPDDDSREPVYKGLRPDVSFLRRIQASVPDHVYAESDADGNPEEPPNDSSGGQARLGGSR